MAHLPTDILLPHLCGGKYGCPQVIIVGASVWFAGDLLQLECECRGWAILPPLEA